MEPPLPNGPTSLKMGPDVVTIENDVLVIYAKRPMPDWKVREFHRHAIHFQGEKYYLRRRTPAAKPFAMRYELAAWPVDLHEESSVSFTYDEAFVAERDRTARTERQHNLLWYGLLPLYPLLGLCWSGFKERVLWPIGFIPISITAASTMLMFGAALFGGIWFGYLGGGIPALLLFILCGLDCMVRYGQVLKDEVVPDGFLEWLVRFRRRKHPE